MQRLRRNDRSMIRWICGVSADDDIPSDQLLEKLGLADITTVLRCGRLRWAGHVDRAPSNTGIGMVTVPERKFVTKIRVRYHDPRWRRQQPVRMFAPRFLLFCIVFHVFDAGYRATVSYCFYVIPESVIEFDKTAVNWCTKMPKILVTLRCDLGNAIPAFKRILVTQWRSW